MRNWHEVGTNGRFGEGTIGRAPSRKEIPMLRSLTDELLELTAEPKGAGRATFATTIACCCCCCCEIVYM